MTAVTADELTVDADGVHEYFYDQGWTDGLPVVPPTPSKVEAMLGASGLAPEVMLGSVPERGREVTAEKAAINAVMAGCRAEYFPVVVAAVEAMLDPVYNPHTALSSSGGAAVCVVVSGPVVRELGMGTLHNALGPGNRANATIGRAVRLIASNVLGARTGEMDASSIGHPGKFTLCIAEETPPEPWRPLNIELGCEPDESIVLVAPAESPHQVANHLNPRGEAVLRTLAAAMRCPETFTVGRGGQVIIVLGNEHRKAVIGDGWSRAEAQEFLVRESRITVREILDAGLLLEQPGWQHVMEPGEDGKLPAVAGPEDILIVTAGAPGAGWSAYIPSWAPKLHSQFSMRKVRLG